MRVRFRFTKLGKIRFTSQRDVARMWERALRRAAVPLAYTEGFSPRPQLSFGLALPTGCESLAEYLDVVLDDRRSETEGIVVSALPGRFSELLPPGIEVEKAALFDRADGSLQQQVTSCSWTMQFSGLSAAELEDRVGSLLAARTVPILRERKGRQELDDLRPSVRVLQVTGAAESVGGGARTVGLVAELGTQPRGVRPAELVRGLIAVSAPSFDPKAESLSAPSSQETAAHGGSPTGAAPGGSAAGAAPAGGTVGIPVLDRACRTQQWIERDGTRHEPLGPSEGASGAGRAAHALERAS
jgi:radical SAM-linked protein